MLCPNDAFDANCFPSGSGLHTVDGQNDDSADDAGDDAEFEVVYDDGDYDDGSNSEVDFFERIHHHIGEAAADSAPKVGCSHYERNCRCYFLTRKFLLVGFCDALTCLPRMIAPCCGKESVSLSSPAHHTITIVI
jgi:hypothetical protein